MVMMIAVGGSRLEAGNSVAGIDALDETQLDEGVESSVDRRDPDRPARPAQIVVDVLGAEAAVLTPEQLDYRLPGTATAVARSRERAQGVLRPGGLRLGHGPSVSSGA